MNSVCAAGGDMLVVSSPENRVIQRYNLGTLERVGSTRCDRSAEITAMAMALFQPSLAVVSYATGGGELAERKFGILDTVSGKVVPITPQRNKRFRENSRRDVVHVRVSDDFKAMVCWCTSHSPQGFSYGILRGPSITLTTEHKDYGALSLASNGKEVYGARGMVVDLTGKVIQTYRYGRRSHGQGHPDVQGGATVRRKWCGPVP
jgi:hypothetical protein